MLLSISNKTFKADVYSAFLTEVPVKEPPLKVSSEKLKLCIYLIEIQMMICTTFLGLLLTLDMHEAFTMRVSYWWVRLDRESFH